MKRLCVSLIFSFICLPVTALQAKLPLDWRYSQQVEVTQPGLIKISLPLDTLDGARPGLEDLRLIDRDGKEIPFVQEKTVQPVQISFTPKKFDLTLQEKATVIRLETGLTRPLVGVIMETPAQDFIKAVQVEGSRDGKKWQLIAQGQPLFRQPQGVSQLRLNLPPAVWPFLRLTVDDRRGPPVTFTGALLDIEGATPPVEVQEVAITDRRESRYQSRLALNLRVANLTLANIHLEVADPLFHRQITAVERIITANEISERPIAAGTIYRFAPEGQQVSGNLTLPLNRQVTTPELLLFIDNEDNPPLTITSIKAARYPVKVVFFAPDPGKYYLLSGNRTCPAPRYDLATLEAKLRAAPATPLTLSARTDNPYYQPGEPLPEILDLGTDLDVSDWRYRKLVQVTQDGIQQVDLDLEVLAKATSAFSDLRLLRQGRQHPYILERTSQRVELTPRIAPLPDPKRPYLSRWQLTLPHSGLPLQSLSCTTATKLFQRRVLLYEQDVPGRGEPFDRLLGQATWRRTPSQPNKTQVLLLSRPPKTTQLTLEIDNGDNPPLELEDFTFFYPLTRLFCKAPQTPATYLYFGNKYAPVPHYDISLVASQVLAAEKVPASLGPAESLKKSAWGEAWNVSRTTSLVFWGALALVVLVLLLLMARLLPKAPPPQG